MTAFFLGLDSKLHDNIWTTDFLKTTQYSCLIGTSSILPYRLRLELPVGVHTIQLIVNDGTVDSEPDNVVVEVVDVTIALAEQLGAVLTNKLNMLEQINTELEKEQQVYDTLEELLDSGVYTGLAHGDMVKAKQKIHSALQHQEQAKQDLKKSIEKLSDALESLGSPI